MKILLEASHEVGLRAGRVLLAERDVDFLGLWKAQGTTRSARSGPAADVLGYDLAATDSAHGALDLAARCSVAGIPLVVWPDDADLPPGSAVAPVVTGANVGSALPAALLTHQAARRGDDDAVEIAWTEPGTPPRRGDFIAFPDPVGMARAYKRSRSTWVAPRDDEWGGAVVRVGSDEDLRIVGVADHAAHLEALVFAATILVASEGGYPPGVHRASEADEQLLNALRRVELDIASWRSSS